MAWGCCLAVEPGRPQRRLPLSGRRAGQEQSRAELTPWPGQWRGCGLGLRPGQGRQPVGSGGGVGGRGRGGGGAGASLCAAAVCVQENGLELAWR